MPPPEDVKGSSPPRPTYEWPAMLSPVRVLLLLVGALFALTLTLSVLRLWEFQTGNWDLGIPMQALWSTNHGHPLYEAGDFEQFGASSWFQVHPSFVAVALVPLYGAFPSAISLFALQSAVVAGAAVPLYAIAKDVTGSERRALLTAGLYLAWPPVLAANLFDFHLESFLPLELFTLFLLWRRGRYALGFVVAVLACVTLEVGPILVAITAIFFLLPPIRETWKRLRSAISHRAGGSAFAALWALGVARSRPWVGKRAVQATLALGVLSVAAYFLLRGVEADPALVFLAPVPVSGNPAVAPIGVGQLGLSLTSLWLAVPQKVGYWLLVYGLVAFLPLRALRTQVLVLPWMVDTLFSHSAYTEWGNQYGFLPVIPLMIGFAYGIRGLELAPLRDWKLAFRPPPATSSPGVAGGRGVGARDPRRAAAWTVFLVGVVLACIVLGPADPLVQTSASVSGYSVSYVPAPGYAQVQELVQLLPSGAVVVASNDLFTFVANDVHAYALLWTPEALPYLPFNATHLPPYVLVSASQFGDLPGWLSSALSQPSVYGLEGKVSPTAAGTVELYAQGYSGPTHTWDP